MKELAEYWSGPVQRHSVMSTATSWVDIILNMQCVTQDGCVKKLIVKPGLQCKGTVNEDSTIVFHYIMFIDHYEEPVDNSFERGKPQHVDLTDSNLCHGLDLAVKTMKKSELSVFAIHYTYAYGDMGIPPRIPKKARLMVAVEMVDFYKVGTSLHIINALSCEDNTKNITFRKVYKRAVKDLKQGNRFQNDEDWYTAMQFYNKGIDLLTKYVLKNEQEQTKQQRVLLRLYLNQAACALKIGRPNVVCMCCREVLNIDPENAKALYRFAIAKLMLEDVEASIHMLETVLYLHPGHPQALKRLEEARDERQMREGLKRL